MIWREWPHLIKPKNELGIVSPRLIKIFICDTVLTTTRSILNTTKNSSQFFKNKETINRKNRTIRQLRSWSRYEKFVSLFCFLDLNSKMNSSQFDLKFSNLVPRKNWSAYTLTEHPPPLKFLKLMSITYWSHV